MLMYKKIDMQLVLILLIALYFIGDMGFESIQFIVLLGAVQLLSVIIHAISAPAMRGSIPRKIYYGLLALACTSIIVIGAWESRASFDELEALAWFTLYTLMMALFYFFICVRELVMTKQAS